MVHDSFDSCYLVVIQFYVVVVLVRECKQFNFQDSLFKNETDKLSNWNIGIILHLPLLCVRCAQKKSFNFAQISLKILGEIFILFLVSQSTISLLVCYRSCYSFSVARYVRPFTVYLKKEKVNGLYFLSFFHSNTYVYIYTLLLLLFAHILTQNTKQPSTLFIQFSVFRRMNFLEWDFPLYPRDIEAKHCEKEKIEVSKVVRIKKDWIFVTKKWAKM